MGLLDDIETRLAQSIASGTNRPSDEGAQEGARRAAGEAAAASALPVIVLEDEQLGDVRVERAEGIFIPARIASTQSYLSYAETHSFDDAMIAVTEDALGWCTDALQHVMELAVKEGKPLVIVATQLGDDAVDTIAINAERGTLDVIAFEVTLGGAKRLKGLCGSAAASDGSSTGFSFLLCDRVLFGYRGFFVLEALAGASDAISLVRVGGATRADRNTSLNVVRKQLPVGRDFCQLCEDARREDAGKTDALVDEIRTLAARGSTVYVRRGYRCRLASQRECGARFGVRRMFGYAPDGAVQKVLRGVQIALYQERADIDTREDFYERHYDGRPERAVAACSEAHARIALIAPGFSNDHPERDAEMVGKKGWLPLGSCCIAPQGGAWIAEIAALTEATPARRGFVALRSDLGYTRLMLLRDGEMLLFGPRGDAARDAIADVASKLEDVDRARALRDGVLVMSLPCATNATVTRMLRRLLDGLGPAANNVWFDPALEGLVPREDTVEMGGASTMPAGGAFARSVGSASAGSQDNGQCAVVLDSYGDNKIALIAVVRAETDLGLAGAKGLVESAPCVVGGERTRGEAERLVAALVAAGGTAHVVR